MKKWLEKYVNPVIPCYAIIGLIACFAWNTIVYNGSLILFADLKHYDFTTSLDRMVPIVPWFVVFYLGSFPFWIVNYVIAARSGKENFYRFITGEFLAKLICFVIFFLLPTTNVRPVITDQSWDWQVLQFVFDSDGGLSPSNLFPSIHCYVSWMSVLAVKGRTEVPVWYRGFSLFMAVMIMVSTQVLKQHYFIDVIGGVLLAEFVYRLNRKVNWYQKTEHIFQLINQFLRIPQSYKRGTL